MPSVLLLTHYTSIKVERSSGKQAPAVVLSLCSFPLLHTCSTGPAGKLQVIRHSTLLSKEGSCNVHCWSLGNTPPHGNAVLGLSGSAQLSQHSHTHCSYVAPNVDLQQRNSDASAPGVYYFKN